MRCPQLLSVPCCVTDFSGGCAHRTLALKLHSKVMTKKWIHSIFNCGIRESSPAFCLWVGELFDFNDLLRNRHGTKLNPYWIGTRMTRMMRAWAVQQLQIKQETVYLLVCTLEQTRRSGLSRFPAMLFLPIYGCSYCIEFIEHWILWYARADVHYAAHILWNSSGRITSSWTNCLNFSSEHGCGQCGIDSCFGHASSGCS